uniref:Uncharacterized protein n=1 Tax=Chromera velia CCMP2878 TaxID=1169474 RepID=A0A0G4IFG2_9ALVE|eukprot:Cvel_2446.t1-p1 / transcript=Cvel_2446.t1 / gene=Cvel_2446 / organism=Chromera_velia_CCMP2878 / gene_product=hypothetical protein / transcript_product=hypothetical protein / location=Cvel_scaffold96:9816-11215(+) / protein_length=397 / sequence_SO=supercontig / SO=protein_coding / is_pseudo=false
MIPLFMAILPEEVNEELMKKGDISDFTELSKTAQHYYELNNPKYASTNPVNAYGVPSTAPQPNKATPIPPIAAVNAGVYPDLSRVLSQLQGQVAALQSQVDRSNSHRGNGGGRGRGNSNRGGHWQGNRQQNGGQNGGGGGGSSDGVKCQVCNGPHFVAECTDPRAEGWRMCQGFYKNRGGSSNRRGRRLGLSSEAFARKCGCEIRETKFDLTAYGGANVEVVGETTLFLSHPQSTLPALPWDVLVTRGTDIEFLLGLDFLSNKKDVIFDLKNNRMIYSHFPVFPLSSTISLQQQPVSIVQRSSIPPRRAEVKVVCSVSGFESGAEIHIEKKWQQENGKFQLVVPDQVLKIKGGGVMKMRVSNFGEEECTLGAGQEIAKAISIENSREQAVAALWADV